LIPTLGDQRFQEEDGDASLQQVRPPFLCHQTTVLHVRWLFVPLPCCLAHFSTDALCRAFTLREAVCRQILDMINDARDME
jgi:hypothetical protein